MQGTRRPPRRSPCESTKHHQSSPGCPRRACTIWPPNHKLVKVATVTATDALSGLAPGSFRVTGTSNDPTNGQIVISGGPNQFIVQLGADKDQIYTLTAMASDLAGNTATATATCTVPHDQGKNERAEVEQTGRPLRVDRQVDESGPSLILTI